LVISLKDLTGSSRTLDAGREDAKVFFLKADLLL
jgi:hypothetical protein